MTKKTENAHSMQALSKLGASKGGKKRMELMTPEERSEHASMAASKRWNMQNIDETLILPRATHPGIVPIGDIKIPCAVLDDKRRILSQRGIVAALGGKRGGSHWQRQQKGTSLPIYVSAGNLAPFIKPSLVIALSQPVQYRPKTGTSVITGVEATLITEICDVWLEARQKEALLPSQEHIAKQAEILMRGLAKVGIIALIDEATGYQYERDRNELNQILEKFISPALLPWTKMFPDDFYKELFRLRGWSYSPFSPKRPILVGKLTNDIVYDRLPQGVLRELQSRNPVIEETGRRRNKHFQHLSEDVGHPYLEKYLPTATTLMRISATWPGFKRLLDKAFPKQGKTIELPLEDIELEP